MSITTHLPQADESSFGIGGQTSHDADVIASDGGYGTPLWGPADGSADEVVEDSHRADIRAAYAGSAKKLVKDGTGLHR